MSGTEAKKTTKRPTTAKRDDVLVARAPFLVPGGVHVSKGTVVSANDPLVKGREHLFDKPEDAFRNTRAS